MTAKRVLKRHSIVLKNEMESEDADSSAEPKIQRLVAPKSNLKQEHSVVDKQLAQEGPDEKPKIAQEHRNNYGTAKTPRCPQRQRVRDIAKAGLVSKFDTLCRTAQVYLKVEGTNRNRSEASSEANAKMIHRFIEWAKCNFETSDEMKILCDSDAANEFGNVLNSTFKPYTAKNHATAMLTLYDVVLCSREVKDSLGFQPHMSNAVRSARDCWNLLKCKLQRAARAKQRQTLQAGHFQNAPIAWTLEFLAVEAPICEKGMSDVNFEDTPRLSAMSRCVAACYMALHGQRLCAVLNMKRVELEHAINSHGRYIVRIYKHKTARFHGASAVALRPHQYHFLRQMSDCFSRNENVFAIHDTGRASKELFAPLRTYISRKYHVDPPDITFNLFRKTIETNSYLTTNSKEECERNINSYLCHGKQVTDLHYRHKSDALVVQQCGSVETVLGSLAALDQVREGRVALPGPLGEYIFWFNYFVKLIVLI